MAKWWLHCLGAKFSNATSKTVAVLAALLVSGVCKKKKVCVLERKRESLLEEQRLCVWLYTALLGPGIFDKVFPSGLSFEGRYLSS